ncbi:MAG: TlpA disulfide reductase family protein [Actinomycetes bacterium]|jgi:thiol-disulfide isomerase/thioredoxin
MKQLRLLMISALLLSFIPSAHAAGSVVSCSAIKTGQGQVKSKTLLSCLDSKSKVMLEGIRGPVVINVFGSWCAPCQQEIPLFVSLYATKKVSIVGIDVEEANIQTGRNFVLKKGITWPILYDAIGATKSSFGPGVPVTWFLDAKGYVVYRHVGLVTSQKQLNSEVAKYLGIKL